jgi:hypothetical protein
VDVEGDVDVQVETLNTAKRKRPRLRAKLEDGSSEALVGQKPTTKRHSKDSISIKFVNISALDYEQTPTDFTETTAVLSQLLLMLWH